MFEYAARVTRVTDGDTLWLDVDLGFRVHLGIDVRLARLNAPETIKMTGTQITDPVVTFIEERVMRGFPVVARITRTEKYGRWLADLFYLYGESDITKIMREGKCLNDELLAAGLVKPYDGGKRT